jgi:hypothetical protein
MKSLALALFLLLAAAPAAQAAVTAKASLVPSGSDVMLQVKVKSTKKFTKKTKPRSVKATLGDATYKLDRVKQKAKVSKWRSDAQSGAAAQVLTDAAGDALEVKVKTKKGSKTFQPVLAGLPPEQGGTPDPGGNQPPPPAQPQLVRDDAAGQQAMGEDLLLEWYEFGASGRTASYRRIWFYADGSFRFNEISWNDVSGEICDKVHTGTWTFKEGYTTTSNGGGVVVKVGVAANDINGDEILQFPNNEPGAVYIGVQNAVRYERNPNMMQNC